MEIGSALICDAVTVREGLLHILGGGITRLHRPMYPAPMGTSLAVQVFLHPTEIEQAHNVQIIVQTEDGGRIAEATVGFQVQGGEIAPGEDYAVPLAVPLGAVIMPAAGGYSIEILIDGQHYISRPFRAILAAAPPPSTSPGYL